MWFLSNLRGLNPGFESCNQNIPDSSAISDSLLSGLCVSDFQRLDRWPRDPDH
jgi:hypothetical protein